MDDLHGDDAQMHMTEAEQQMHVHYMHDQSHGMHHMNNGNVMEDDHDDGVTNVGEGIDGELHNDPGNVSDTHGGMIVANGDNNQLTLSFQELFSVMDSSVAKDYTDVPVERIMLDGLLLEHTVDNLDPLHIVNVMPDGLEIPRLISSIYRQSFVNLLVKYYKEARHAIYMNNTEDEARTKRDEKRMEKSFAKPPSFKEMDLKSKTRVGGAEEDVAYALILFPSKMYRLSFSFAVMHIT